MIAYLEYNKFKTSRDIAEKELLVLCDKYNVAIKGEQEHIMVSSPLRENEPPIYAPIMAVKCNVK